LHGDRSGSGGSRHYRVVSKRQNPSPPESSMTQNAAWYFAYGSNMNRAQFRSRAPQMLEEINAELKNYELVFNKKVRGGTASANIQQAPGKSVHGVLYRISEITFKSLDRYEGAPVHYRRIEVKVNAADGREMNAQVFIAAKVEKGLKPASHYVQTILTGAEEHGLSPEYLDSIREAAK
jgi:cation transport regulator ChaC